MKYEKPNIEVIWLESREIFMTVSDGSISGTTGGDTGSGFVDDEEW